MYWSAGTGADCHANPPPGWSVVRFLIASWLEEKKSFRSRVAKACRMGGEAKLDINCLPSRHCGCRHGLPVTSNAIHWKSGTWRVQCPRPSGRPRARRQIFGNCRCGIGKPTHFRGEIACGSQQSSPVPYFVHLTAVTCQSRAKMRQVNLANSVAGKNGAADRDVPTIGRRLTRTRNPRDGEECTCQP